MNNGKCGAQRRLELRIDLTLRGYEQGNMEWLAVQLLISRAARAIHSFEAFVTRLMRGRVSMKRRQGSEWKWRKRDLNICRLGAIHMPSCHTIDILC